MAEGSPKVGPHTGHSASHAVKPSSRVHRELRAHLAADQSDLGSAHRLLEEGHAAEAIAEKHGTPVEHVHHVRRLLGALLEGDLPTAATEARQVARGFHQVLQNPGLSAETREYLNTTLTALEPDAGQSARAPRDADEHRTGTAEHHARKPHTTPAAHADHHATANESGKHATHTPIPADHGSAGTSEDHMTEVREHEQELTHHYVMHFPPHPAREDDPHYKDFDHYHNKTRKTARCYVGERIGFRQCRDAEGRPARPPAHGGEQPGLELHHAHVEFSLQHGISLKALEKDYPGISDKDEVGDWLESAENLRWLCAYHHRGAGGAHTAAHADWEAAQYVLSLITPDDDKK